MIEKNKNTSEHLANERTFLAWTRTSISLMGFGFVIVKFALFLKQLSFELNNPAIPQNKGGHSAGVGVTMILVGIVIAILAFFRYKNTEKSISNYAYQSSSKLPVFMTFCILLGGILLIFYLIKSL